MFYFRLSRHLDKFWATVYLLEEPTQLCSLLRVEAYASNSVLFSNTKAYLNFMKAKMQISVDHLRHCGYQCFHLKPNKTWVKFQWSFLPLFPPSWFIVSLFRWRQCAFSCLVQISQILLSFHKLLSSMCCLHHYRSPHHRLRLARLEDILTCSLAVVFIICYENSWHITRFFLSWSYWGISSCIIITYKYKLTINSVKNMFCLWAVHKFFEWHTNNSHRDLII